MAEINQGRVPEGYKKTSLGVIPEDWEDKTLSDIGDFYKGKGIPGKELQDDGLPCVGYGDIYMKYNYHFERALNFVNQKTADESQPIQKGTLLFTGSGETAEEIGKCVCYNGEETIYAGGDIILYNSDVNPLFVSYQQSIEPSIKAKANFAQGHSVVHIYADRLGKLSVAYPQNKDEQQQIAEILMKWDEAIALQEKLIEKLELHKKALMQQLLTPKEDWTICKLGEISSMTSGGTPKSSMSEYYDGDIVWVSINDMSNCGKYLFDSERKLTDEGIKNSSAKIFPVNTVLYAMYASIGECCIAKVECSTSQAILGITPSSKLQFEFLYYYLVNLKEKIKLQGQKGTQSNLNKEIVCDFRLALPTIDEQKTISDILLMLDQNIVLNQQKLNTIKLQQKSLMQLLLTGIVRV